MNYEYTKASPIRLRDAGKDERWLQELLTKDPPILNLGDLQVLRRERAQPSGGRIDLLLEDKEANIQYEVEVMLGKTDPSHIIRTIEYWDNERRRSSNCEHVAVIVAEEITNRFFNVIGLLNKAVPIIALQLHAFVVGDKLCLTFVRVLDQTEEQKEDEGGDPVDRKYWETRASKKSLELMDAIIALVPKDAGDVRVKYNGGHVALGTSGTNFCWFHPRRGAQIHIHAKPGEEARKALIPKLQEKGIESSPRRSDEMTASLTVRDFEESKDVIQELIMICEQNSRK